ncbi:MAG: hypothetical protein OJJ54_13075 [Pseudonocardia sp.]|nr:hypothetical protein [Pseudonocardia sp.]
MTTVFYPDQVPMIPWGRVLLQVRRILARARNAVHPTPEEEPPDAL